MSLPVYRCPALYGMMNTSRLSSSVRMVHEVDELYLETAPADPEAPPYKVISLPKSLGEPAWHAIPAIVRTRQTFDSEY